MTKKFTCLISILLIFLTACNQHEKSYQEKSNTGNAVTKKSADSVMFESDTTGMND
jgi:hypothetical protein